MNINDFFEHLSDKELCMLMHTLMVEYDSRNPRFQDETFDAGQWEQLFIRGCQYFVDRIGQIETAEYVKMLDNIPLPKDLEIKSK